MSLDWRSSCELSEGMNNSVAFPDTLRQQPRELGKRLISCEPTLPSWTVNLECRLAADTGRIFHALTIPEYMEAWICVPSYHLECHIVTCPVAHGFQIEHHCKSGTTTRITGRYLAFLKRKLSFSWSRAGALGSWNSIVDIRLCGDFDKSILRLRHCGLASEEDFNWHSTLWSASIDRLRRLFEKTAISAGQHKSWMSRRRSKLCSEP